MDSLHENIVREKRGYYFESYSELDCHEVMIKDWSRTFTYKQAIEMNSHLFEGKVVLDVGCGLGILSLFAARAGAKTVIGIDAADVAVHAEKIVKANKFSNIIIQQAKIEEIEELPLGIQEVDIIVSEWMGYCLYHESMLATVLCARDKWLKKEGGLIFPDEVRLYLAAVDDSSMVERIERWNSVAGCDMSVLKDISYKEAAVICVDPHKVVTDGRFLLHKLDLNTVSSNFSFTKKYRLQLIRDCNVRGFITFFEAIFSKCHKKIILKTSPHDPYTHWKQTMFPFEDEMWLTKDSEIAGEFTLEPFKHNFRDLHFRITVNSASFDTTYRFTCQYVLR